MLVTSIRTDVSHVTKVGVYGILILIAIFRSMWDFQNVYFVI